MIAFNVFKGDTVNAVLTDHIDIHIDDLYKEICDEYLNSEKFSITNVLNKHNCKLLEKKDIKEGDVTLVIFINLDEEHLQFHVYKVPNILLYAKTRYKKTKIKGNCVDEFIIKGLYGELNSIDYYIHNILDRKKDRINCLDYHQTACYEHDFSSICNIKKCLEKLLSNCNKQIEQMSDKYTKL